MSGQAHTAALGHQRHSGLQPERTALSWQRTGLSAAMVSFLTAFAGVRLGVLPIAIPAVVVSAATAVVAIIHFPRGQLDAHGHNRPWPVLVRIGVIVITTAVLGAIVGVIGVIASLS